MKNNAGPLKIRFLVFVFCFCLKTNRLYTNTEEFLSGRAVGAARCM